jgi:hypothetical protein
VIAALAVNEGVATWRGEGCCAPAAAACEDYCCKDQRRPHSRPRAHDAVAVRRGGAVSRQPSSRRAPPGTRAGALAADAATFSTTR